MKRDARLNSFVPHLWKVCVSVQLSVWGLNHTLLSVMAEERDVCIKAPYTFSQLTQTVSTSKKTLWYSCRKANAAFRGYYRCSLVCRLSHPALRWESCGNERGRKRRDKDGHPFSFSNQPVKYACSHTKAEWILRTEENSWSDSFFLFLLKFLLLLWYEKWGSFALRRSEVWRLQMFHRYKFWCQNQTGVFSALTFSYLRKWIPL